MSRILFTETLRLLQDFFWHPLRKWNVVADMTARGQVFFVYLRDLIGGQAVRQPDQGGPEPTMDKGQLPIDQATNKDVRRVADGLNDPENLPALRVSPPASTDWPAGNDFDEAWSRSPGRCENDAVLANERQCLLGGHEPTPLAPGAGDAFGALTLRRLAVSLATRRSSPIACSHAKVLATRSIG